MSQHTTPNGKTVSTYMVPNSNHVAIKFNQGGELPEELTGLFTSHKVADQAIYGYLSKQEQKKATDKKV